MPKRITVSVTVADAWPYSHEKARVMKNDLAVATLERVRKWNLDLLAIEAKVGTARKS